MKRGCCQPALVASSMPPETTDDPAPHLPLLGRSALVTGVSRRRGIGFAVARRFAELGANVFIQHCAPHDDEQPWGSDDLDLVRGGIRSAQPPGALFGEMSAYLAERFADVHTPAASTMPGVRHHSGGPFDEMQTGRAFWMTSGQQDGPMPGEVAYAASKAALAGITATVASELLARGILLTTINPGPVNTGYLDPETTDRPLDDFLAQVKSTAFGRVGRPDDPARLIGWLATDDGRWIAGQVMTTDGGSGCSRRRRCAGSSGRKNVQGAIVPAARMASVTDTTSIRLGDLGDERVIRLLTDHLADMFATSPAESVHALDVSGLAEPGVTLWTVADGDTHMSFWGASQWRCSTRRTVS